MNKIFVNKNTAYLIFGLSFFFTILIYQPFGLYFLNDDFVHLPLSENGRFFQRNFTRPIHELLLNIEFLVWNRNATGFHFTALLLHLICAFLFFELCKLLATQYGNFEKSTSVLFAIIATSFFLIYAFHSEAIFWILGRGASLCAMFFLLSVICFIKKKERKVYFIFSIVSFLLGLFTYESIWIAPIIVLLISMLEIKLKNGSAKLELGAVIYFWLVFFLFLAFRFFLFGEIINSYESRSLVDFDWQSIVLNYNRLIARSFLPPMQSTLQFVCAYILILLLLIAGTISFLKKPRKDLLLGFLFCAFLISVLPYISLGIDTHDTESERFLYLPSIFFCLWLSYVIMKLKLSNTIKSIAFCLLLFINAFYAFSNSTDFRVASEISKASLKELSAKMISSNSVSVKNLPVQIRGVKIFQVGFKEGLGWLYQVDTAKIKVFKTIEIHSTKIQLNRIIMPSNSFHFVLASSLFSSQQVREFEFIYDLKSFQQKE